MKQFIVLMGVLPILLIFLLQFAFENRNSQITGKLQDYVYAAKEEAKQEGYFSKEITDRLKKNISMEVGVSPEEVLVESEKEIKYRYGHGKDRLIYYRVEVPIKKVMAANDFFGISDEENSYLFVIDSYTASEKI